MEETDRFEVWIASPWGSDDHAVRTQVKPVFSTGENGEGTAAIPLDDGRRWRGRDSIKAKSG